MSAEIFFIFDSHCPWSYATTDLVSEIAEAFPQIKINLWHSARYDGDESITLNTLKSVSTESNCKFGEPYKSLLPHKADSTITANLMAWAALKTPQIALSLLKAIQEKHFQQGSPLTNESDFTDIISQLKLSPASKIFNGKKLTKDAGLMLQELFELQDVIGTEAIPALLLAVNDNLILLSHHLYLKQPSSIIDIISTELNK